MAQAAVRHILVESESFCNELKDKIINGEGFFESGGLTLGLWKSLISGQGIC